MKAHIAISGLFLSLSACGQGFATPEFKIWVAGDTDNIAASDIDKAWMVAAAIVQVPDQTILAQGLYVTFEAQPIAYADTLYSGLTVGYEVQVLRRSCVLAGNSALIHEFGHVALGLKTGDEDINHTSPEWVRLNGQSTTCAEVGQ